MALGRTGKWLLVLCLGVGGLALVFWSMTTEDIPVAQLLPKYATGASKFIDVDGMSVHVRDEGQGPPLLLLHGTGASLQTWDDWTATLSAHHRVIRMDLPGFGLTGPSREGNYTIPAFVAFVEAFRIAMGLSQFAIAGNSLGGQIAWSYAVAYPQHVTALILIDPAGFPIRRPALVFRLARIPVLSGLLSSLDPGHMVRKTLREAYGDRTKVTPALIERYRDLSLRAGNRKAFVSRAQQSQVDASSEISHVQAPTLLLWGREDRLIPVSDAERFAKAIPGAELIIYDGVGHVPMEEIGQRSALDAEAFLSKQSVDAAQRHSPDAGPAQPF